MRKYGRNKLLTAAQRAATAAQNNNITTDILKSTLYFFVNIRKKCFKHWWLYFYGMICPICPYSASYYLAAAGIFDGHGCHKAPNEYSLSPLFWSWRRHLSLLRWRFQSFVDGNPVDGVSRFYKGGTFGRLKAPGALPWAMPTLPILRLLEGQIFLRSQLHFFGPPKLL